MLSDHPCGAGAKLREVAQPNRMLAQDTSRLYERAPQQRAVPSVGGEAPWVKVQACAQIERRIKPIKARMCRQYTAGEGERLCSQLRALSARQSAWPPAGLDVLRTAHRGIRAGRQHSAYGKQENAT